MNQPSPMFSTEAQRLWWVEEKARLAAFKARTAPDPNQIKKALPEMSIAQIARSIQADWGSRGKGVNFAAKPYLEAMHDLRTVNDLYGYDSGKSIVLYFLCNARSYRGVLAKLFKAELRKRTE